MYMCLRACAYNMSLLTEMCLTIWWNIKDQLPRVFSLLGTNEQKQTTKQIAVSERRKRNELLKFPPNNISRDQQKQGKKLGRRNRKEKDDRAVRMVPDSGQPALPVWQQVGTSNPQALSLKPF